MSKERNDKPTSSQETQAEKFERLAHEVEADEDEGAFEDKLKRLAQQKPKDKDAGDK